VALLRGIGGRVLVALDEGAVVSVVVLVGGAMLVVFESGKVERSCCGFKENRGAADAVVKNVVLIPITRVIKVTVGIVNSFIFVPVVNQL
jgi:urease alpha subunit